MRGPHVGRMWPAGGHRRRYRGRYRSGHRGGLQQHRHQHQHEPGRDGDRSQYQSGRRYLWWQHERPPQQWRHRHGWRHQWRHRRFHGDEPQQWRHRQQLGNRNRSGQLLHEHEQQQHPSSVSVQAAPLAAQGITSSAERPLAGSFLPASPASPKWFLSFLSSSCRLCSQPEGAPL
jgi:hypothetical protein